MKFDDIIINTVTRILLPFILIFGFYLIVHVHLSPGGGFSGGTVVGSSFVLFSLSYGILMKERKLPHSLTAILESSGGLWFIFLGLVSVFLGQNFLVNSPVFSLGTPGRLFSSGIVLLVNIGIGVKVAATIISLFDCLGGEDL